MTTDDESSSLLVTIFDVNPAWWSNHDLNKKKEETFVHCLESLMVFINSHLLLKHTNKLGFIVCHGSNSTFVYPEREGGLKEDTTVHDGKYEEFAKLDSNVVDEVKQIYLNATDDISIPESSSKLAGAMSQALCYIHRIMKDSSAADKLNARILTLHMTEEIPQERFQLGQNPKPLVWRWKQIWTFKIDIPTFHAPISSNKIVKGTNDVASQYMSVMSCIFAAQKNDIIVDGCTLGEDSGYLQQAADITGGNYLKVNSIAGLLQYLLWVFLPDPVTRKSLVLPAATQIDYRGACFCHRQLVDVGFVCSVCLSIYCKFIPRCMTCQTLFKLPALPMTSKAKKRKRT